MITKEQLTEGFEVNVRLIQRQTEGLTHADSLLHTPYNINTLNWVIGHIAVNRDRVLRLIGETTLLSDAEFDRYKTGSDPVREDDGTVIRLERLLEILVEGQQKIRSRLSQSSDEDLLEKIQVGEQMIALGQRLYGLYFHDTYHTGQTDLLRQVAGTNDKII
jgi:uncharacterized damage-inducible protein DinB